MTDDELKHLCKLGSIWAGHVLSSDFDPSELGDEPPENIKNCHQILAQAFVGLLAKHPEMKPSFRVFAHPVIPSPKAREDQL